MRNSVGKSQHFIGTRSAFCDWSIPDAEVQSAVGAWIRNSNGDAFLDFAGGSGSLIFGHSDELAISKITEQARKFSLYPAQSFHCPVVTEYLRVLTRFAGGEFSRALTTTSGTDAVEAACKLSIQYHQARGDGSRIKIIGRAGSYHGNSLKGLSIGGHSRRRAPYEQALGSAIHSAAAFCYRCQYGRTPETCHVECGTSVENQILAAGPETVAAFIVEPVVGATLGVAIPDDRYLSVVRNVCDQYGVLLIVDEVITGFGRTGESFGWHHWNVQPDIMILGKAISAGYFPLSAVVTTDRVADTLRLADQYFENGQTHLFNPIGAALGTYVVERIREEDLSRRAAVMGRTLLERLTTLRRFPIIGDVRGLGLMLGIELVRDAHTKKQFPESESITRRFSDAALQAGLIVYPGGGGAATREGDHVLLLPPLTIGEREIDTAVECLELAAISVQRTVDSCT